MNKKIVSSISIISLFTTMFFCSCSKNTSEGSNNISMTAESNLSNTPSKTIGIDKIETTPFNSLEVNLPEGYTVGKIKSSLLEYINYRLWLYPIKFQDATSDKDFDKYIDKSIDVEIRVYTNNSEKSVYAYTNIGNWLAVFKNSNGFVYCDGQVGENETLYPEGNNYQVIEKYSIEIQKPHKPNYGNSPRKDKMIAALESSLKSSCEEYYLAEKEWTNVNVYIADFYEYEMGAHAWLCKENGSITCYPVNFDEENGQFEIQKLKGYTFESKGSLNKFGSFQLERYINDAVKNFKCNVK